MKWRNLVANRCPKDGSPLKRTEHGYQCEHKDDYYQTTCDFFITHAKAKELKESVKRYPTKRSAA